MSCNCCSENSSRSLGSYQRYPASSCVSSYPSNLVYSPDLCSPSPSPLNRGCLETCCEPIRCHMSCEVSPPCQTSCYHRRPSTLCSTCLKIYMGSLNCGSSSCYSLDCGFCGIRPLGDEFCDFSSLRNRSGIYYPTYWASRSCHYSCYSPTDRSSFFRSTC